jgi:hypothetical protein
MVSVGLAGFGLTVSAQQINRGTGLASFAPMSRDVSALTLANGRSFPFSAPVAWMDSTPHDFLPNWRPSGWDNSGVNLSFATGDRSQPMTATTGSTLDGFSKDSPKESPELRKNYFDYVHGEVGFFYGAGKGGRTSFDTEGGYIYGETGNDKFQIGAGAFYENTNYQFPRRGH